jgi:hypothetical protein
MKICAETFNGGENGTRRICRPSPLCFLTRRSQQTRTRCANFSHVTSAWVRFDRPSHLCVKAALYPAAELTELFDSYTPTNGRTGCAAKRPRWAITGR